MIQSKLKKIRGTDSSRGEGEGARDEEVSMDSLTNETVIGAETRYKGSISTSNILRIDGYFEGEIKSDNDIFVSALGVLKGTVECQSLHTSGKVDGSAVVYERLTCTPTGKIQGDVTVKELILEEGAVFDGHCNMSKFNSLQDVTQLLEG